MLIPQDDPLQFPDSSAAEQSAKKLGTDGFAAVLMAPTAPSPGASPSPQINQLRYGSNERVSVESMFLYYGLPFGILIVMLGIVALRYQAVRRKKRLLKQRAEVTVQNEAFKSASALDAA